jgi:ribose-phosphate pyrophosphokinase
MNTLNLICAQHSDLPYTAMVFPDGQPHLKLDTAAISKVDRSAPVRILSRMANANDLLLILFAKNTLDYLEFRHVELHLSYLLAARMDRVMVEGEPFSLKVIASMINGMAFSKLKIFDSHSDVATALVDRSYVVPNHQFVKDAIGDYLKDHPAGACCLVSPDAGALKKVHKLAAFLGMEDVVECMKERDLKTGALVNFETTAEDLGGQTCFIVDDICDGGGTFAGVATLLREKGAHAIVLIVSHGIFSRGIAIPSIDAVYTTDSYRRVEGVSCFPIERYLNA